MEIDTLTKHREAIQYLLGEIDRAYDEGIEFAAKIADEMDLMELQSNRLIAAAIRRRTSQA